MLLSYVCVWVRLAHIHKGTLANISTFLRAVCFCATRRNKREKQRQWSGGRKIKPQYVIMFTAHTHISFLSFLNWLLLIVPLRFLIYIRMCNMFVCLANPICQAIYFSVHIIIYLSPIPPVVTFACFFSLSPSFLVAFSPFITIVKHTNVKHNNNRINDDFFISFYFGLTDVYVLFRDLVYICDEQNSFDSQKTVKNEKSIKFDIFFFVAAHGHVVWVEQWSKPIHLLQKIGNLSSSKQNAFRQSRIRHTKARAHTHTALIHL